MLKTCRCQRCGHVWIPRIEDVVQCPKCKSPRWNQKGPTRPEAKNERVIVTKDLTKSSGANRIVPPKHIRKGGVRSRLAIRKSSVSSELQSPSPLTRRKRSKIAILAIFFILTAQCIGQAKISPQIKRMGANQYTGIVIHQTATKQGENYTYEQCKDYHVGERGWADCGYHFIIQPSGEITEARNLNKKGAHCGHACNQNNIGVAFSGIHRATRTQLESFELLRQSLAESSGRDLEVTPHKAHKHTNCPEHIFDQIMEFEKQNEQKV